MLVSAEMRFLGFAWHQRWVKQASMPSGHDHQCCFIRPWRHPAPKWPTKRTPNGLPIIVMQASSCKGQQDLNVMTQTVQGRNVPAKPHGLTSKGCKKRGTWMGHWWDLEGSNLQSRACASQCFTSEAVRQLGSSTADSAKHNDHLTFWWCNKHFCWWKLFTMPIYHTRIKGFLSAKCHVIPNQSRSMIFSGSGI